jgi:hypothetical protein
MRRLLLVVLCALASCVPLSDQPAGDERSAAFDTRLQGVWRAVGEDEPVLVFIGPGDDGAHGLHVVTVEETRDHRWKTAEYDGITTRRGRGGFLSVRYETTGGDRRGWVTARYTAASRDHIQFSTLDHERLAALIHAEKIPGRVTGDGPYADVDITMSGADLLAFLESPDGARLFGPPHTLVRGDPPHAAAGGARRRDAHQSTSTGAPPASGR